MIHRCRVCGFEIVSWTDKIFKREIKEHYKKEHGKVVKVIWGWNCLVKSSTMPHKGLVQTFRVEEMRV